MVLDKAFLGKAPEAFKAVDVDFGAGVDAFTVIHPEVSISAEHKGIADLELVRVVYASEAHLPLLAVYCGSLSYYSIL
jgi:hypothetical protein